MILGDLMVSKIQCLSIFSSCMRSREILQDLIRSRDFSRDLARYRKNSQDMHKAPTKSRVLSSINCERHHILEQQYKYVQTLCSTAPLSSKIIFMDTYVNRPPNTPLTPGFTDGFRGRTGGVFGE